MIVDDEPQIRKLLIRTLEAEGYTVTAAKDGKAAVDIYRTMPQDAVITDMHMPGMDGLALIHAIQRLDSDAAIIVLTGYGELDNAVDALRNDGVYHYLTKPMESPEVLFIAVSEAIEKRRLVLQNKALLSKLQRSNRILDSRVKERTQELDAANRQLTEELNRRKRSEEALEQARQNLEHKVAQRTSRLVDLNQQLKAKVEEQRRTEAALVKSEHNAQVQLLELELLYSSSPAGFCMLDKDMKLIRGNKTMAQIVGLPLENQLGNTLQQISPRLSAQIETTCRKLMSTSQPRLSYLVSLSNRDSSKPTTHWLASSYPLILQDGTAVATCHVFQNITELRHAEQQISRSKTILQAMFDGISDPLVAVDHQMTIRLLNKAAKEYYGLNNFHDMLGKRCLEASFFPSTAETLNISDVVTSGKSEMFERPGFMDKEKIEKVAVYPLSKSAIGLSGAIIQITDITETKSLERQLLQNEKLASLGMLVAGIAHEINNPNGFISFNLPILRKYVDAMVTEMDSHQVMQRPIDWFGLPFDKFKDEVFSLIGNMEHGTQRISKIVSSLRALVRSETNSGSHPPISMSDIIDHVQTLVRVELQQRVQVFTVECPDDLPLIKVDTEAFEQVMINLLINAAHAADKTQAWIKLTVARSASDTLTIEIQDNGCGIDKTLQEKIFSPFFTTKEPGAGTGIGLSLCHNLVKSLGGHIEVESTVGEGSTFRLILPVQFVNNPTLSDSKSAPEARPKQALASPTM